MRGRWLKMVCPNGLLAPAGLSKWSVLLVCPNGLSLVCGCAFQSRTRVRVPVRMREGVARATCD